MANTAQKRQMHAPTAAVIATGERVKLRHPSPANTRRHAFGAFGTTAPSTTGVDTDVTSA